MTRQDPRHLRVLGVHPAARGFGWIVCEGPLRLVDAGVFLAFGPSKNERCLGEVERLISRFAPAELVLESFDPERSHRSQRVHQLCLHLASLAGSRGLRFSAHSRETVQRAFGGVGAKTREEIAEAVARHFPALRPRLPRKRKRWESEDKRLAIFNAAAVVLASYENGATALLDELRDAA